MIFLRGNTASQEIVLGQFFDSTDGNTEETALTIANTDILLHKNGATTLANKNSGGATHISNGIYYAVLDATDTNTYGKLTIFCHVAGALGVKVECMVLAEPVYDSMFPAASGDVLPVFGVLDWGTAQTSTTTNLVLRAGASFADNELIGSMALPYGGTSVDPRIIFDSVGATDTVSVSPDFSNAPNASYVIIAGPRAPTDSAVLPTVLLSPGTGTGQVSLSSGAVTVGTNNDKTGYGLATGAITAAVIATDAIDADAIAADAVTEIQSGLATAANLATVDTVVDGIAAGIITGAAATGTLSTTQATTNLTGYADDQLIGRVIIWTSGAADGEATDITDYAATGGLLTFTALTTAPGNGDTFKIV